MPDLLVVTHDVRGDGIAATKNRGIAALMDEGCDHLFLADDDVWPTSKNWAQPYVADPEPHLMHCWGRSRFISDDGRYTTWTHPRGVLLYAERRVIEAVGGMRLEFGRWGGEHVEWSQRIHAAGLTKHLYADLAIARNGIWHALDVARSIPSSVSTADRQAYERRKGELFTRFGGTTDYVDFR